METPEWILQIGKAFIALEFKDKIGFFFNVLTYCGLIISILLTFLQLRKNDRVAKASFWLELRKMFDQYDNVHKSLQCDERWRTSNGADPSKEYITEIVRYMGLFEHCYNLLKDGLIDLDVFKSIYSYRLYVIMNTPKLVEATLVNNGRYWEDFRSLLILVGYTDLPERRDIDLSHKEVTFPVGWS